jgi:beta-1,4-mannosyl-glycoprotein beta-1,4-N-acetylglucosaminyltransferase
VIYDCFTYCGEEAVLEVRLNELVDVVDRFVIVEAAHTFRGKPRTTSLQTYYAHTMPWKFRKKVVPIFVTEPLPIDPWRAEAYVRNQIERGLTQCGYDDLVLISDVDEIPRASAIREAARLLQLPYAPTYVQFNLSEHYYKFDWLIEEQINQIRPVMTKWSPLMHRPQEVRTQAGVTIDLSYALADAGWHFSCMLSPERLSRKLSSFAHSELDTPEVNDVERLRECIDNGVDLLLPPRFTMKPVELDDTYPEYLVANRERFKHLLR